MGFIMDGLDAEDYDRNIRDGELVRRILGYFRPAVARMVVVAVTILLTSLREHRPADLHLAEPRRIPASRPARVVWHAGADRGVIIVLGTLGWVFNSMRQWLSAAAVGNVMLKLREDAFDAVLQARPVVLRQLPLGQDRQPRQLRHAGLLAGRDAGDRPAEPDSADLPAGRLPVPRQRAADADSAAARAVHRRSPRWPSAASPATRSPSRAA